MRNFESRSVDSVEGINRCGATGGMLIRRSSLRMILSGNRFPSPIGVEDVLFGIMRQTDVGRLHGRAHALSRFAVALVRRVVDARRGRRALRYPSPQSAEGGE